jgi:hypothetical protein
MLQAGYMNQKSEVRGVEMTKHPLRLATACKRMANEEVMLMLIAADTAASTLVRS